MGLERDQLDALNDLIDSPGEGLRRERMRHELLRKRDALERVNDTRDLGDVRWLQGYISGIEFVLNWPIKARDEIRAKIARASE